MDRTAAYWIDHLNLQQHPEGGYFREVYRCREHYDAQKLPGRYNGNRVFATSIYFLLTSKAFSAFHRLKSDEIWNFYYGSPLTLYILSDEGQLSKINLGQTPENGEELQWVVPAGSWFAASVNRQNSYSLVGCSVAPGFEFDDFELGKRADLAAQFPHYSDLIKSLTRS